MKRLKKTKEPIYQCPKCKTKRKLIILPDNSMQEIERPFLGVSMKRKRLKKIGLHMTAYPEYPHADLLIERDVGNEILVLMGRDEYALPSWKKLRRVCNQAIELVRLRMKERKIVEERTRN